jgi:hypothetical protein
VIHEVFDVIDEGSKRKLSNTSLASPAEELLYLPDAWAAHGSLRRGERIRKYILKDNVVSIEYDPNKNINYPGGGEGERGDERGGLA